MTKWKVSSILATVLISASGLFAQNMPFPQAKTYPGTIKPAIDQHTLNAQTAAAYEEYKSRFLQKAKSTPGGYYIRSSNTAGSWDIVTVSEAHGWGMVIMTKMAGHDPEAKKIFDGMLALYDNHRNSLMGQNLMGWQVYGQVGSHETHTSQLNYQQRQQNSNAADGDLDIAYALLLAYKQWGDISYRTRAIAMLQDIRAYNIHPTTKHVLLGNWASYSGSEAHWYTRPSDWMGGHFRTFAEATGDSYWTDVANTIYDIYTKFQENDYVNYGLVSDFIRYDGTSAHSAPSDFLSERMERHPDKYFTNSVRVPWRVMADYALSGNQGAKSMLDNLNGFINSKIPTWSSVYEGYYLSGDPISTRAGGAAYLGPFVTATMAGTNQTRLTQGWNTLVATPTNDAYQAAIKLQCLLLMSGNWWHYNDVNTGIDPITFDTSGIYFDDFTGSSPHQTNISYQYGMEHLPSEPWEAGGWWYTYNTDESGSVTSASGEEITADNTIDMFDANANTMDVRINGGGTIEAGFPMDTMYDLTALTGLTVTAKGSGNLRISLLTDDSEPLEDDEFYGGYGTNIALTGEMTQHQILSALLGPRAYSKEATNGWSWDTHGASGVKGVRITSADGREVSATIASIKLNGSEITNETFGFSTPIEIDPVDGINVLSYGTWGVYFDELGSDGTINKNIENDSIASLNVVFDRKAFSEPEAYDTYVSLSGTFSGDFSDLTTVQITYTADQSFRLSLPLPGLTDGDGTAHFITLPVAEEPRTIVRPLSEFRQPAWVSSSEYYEETPMDPSLLEGVTFQLDSDSQGEIGGTITINSILFEGAVIDRVSILTDRRTVRSSNDILNIASRNRNLNISLNLVEAGMVEASLYNLDGRRVASLQRMLQAGNSTLDLNTAHLGTGVYMLRLKGNGAVHTQRINIVR
ncbi:chitosanase/beta-glucanase [Chitinispirillum alkaliphilum]|nr:chitosanase/beta-glucanase [Chitinispirillum alkaliphilum]